MKALRVLSLGAGVQSSTVLRMSIAGDLPPLDAAIFADTGWEPSAVYDHLSALEAEATRAGIPLHRVKRGDLRADALDPEHRFASMPIFVENQRGGVGMMRRQCTKEYKIEPIRRRLRMLMREVGARRAEQWFGISLDEIGRMRDSDRRYLAFVYPLIERRMTRSACLKWNAGRGFPPPPRSACIGCPFHGDREWRAIRENADEWEDAVAFDAAIRESHAAGSKTLRGTGYLHRRLIPLAEVDLRTPEERGQSALFEDDGFEMECASGVCGL